MNQYCPTKYVMNKIWKMRRRTLTRLRNYIFSPIKFRSLFVSSLRIGSLRGICCLCSMQVLIMGPNCLIPIDQWRSLILKAFTSQRNFSLSSKELKIPPKGRNAIRSVRKSDLIQFNVTYSNGSLSLFPSSSRFCKNIFMMISNANIISRPAKIQNQVEQNSGNPFTLQYGYIRVVIRLINNLKMFQVLKQMLS